MSRESRAAAVRAAAGVLEEHGWRGFTVDEVARRSGVGKATLYRHWPSGFPLAVEAWGDVVTSAVPTIATGDVVGDLRGQMRRLAAFYASRQGLVAAELLGASIQQPDGPELVAEMFFRERRDATRALIREGVAAGQLQAGLEPDLVIDMLFGPLVFRLFNGRGPLDQSATDAIADMVLPAIARRRD